MLIFSVEAIAQVDSRPFDKTRPLGRRPKARSSTANDLVPIKALVSNEADPLVRLHCGELVGSITPTEKLRSESRCVTKGYSYPEGIDFQLGMVEREAREFPSEATT